MQTNLEVRNWLHLDFFPPWISGVPSTSTVGLLSVPALTPAIVVAELSEKHKRLNREFESKYDFVKARTRIVPLEEELGRVAGEINFARKQHVKGWGLADSIVLATARQLGSKIVTGDPHFKDLVGETIML